MIHKNFPQYSMFTCIRVNYGIMDIW